MQRSLLIPDLARRVASGLLVALLAAVTAVPAGAQNGAIAEDNLKAAFLYNFAKYVEWPASAFSTGSFRVCVFADLSFVRKVDEIIDGETIDGLRVVRPPTPAPQDVPRSCNVLFVSATEAARTEELLAAAHNAHVLTVGDGDGFLARGGMFAFIKDQDRIRFDVNASEAARAGLTVSSRLLRLARRVKPPSAGGRP